MTDRDLTNYDWWWRRLQWLLRGEQNFITNCKFNKYSSSFRQKQLQQTRRFI